MLPICSEYFIARAACSRVLPHCDDLGSGYPGRGREGLLREVRAGWGDPSSCIGGSAGSYP